jgi:hypothetical protein
MRTTKYLFAILLVMGGAHLAWSAAMVAALTIFFNHRVPNVTKVPNLGRHWEEITSSFVVESIADARRSNRPLALFLGSSVTYGYPWQEPVIFSRLFADKVPGFKVANLSIVAAGMRALTDFATCALDEKHRPDILLVEIPLVNSTTSVKSDFKYKPRECAQLSERISGYWPLVLRRPYGTGWVSMLWDEHAYDKPEKTLKIVKVPSDYFADRKTFESMESMFISELRLYLTTVSRMGSRVYVYVSPVYTPGIDESGGDRQAVEYQIALTNRVCREFAQVTCLDSTPFNSQRDLFYNLTHLNQQGHRALANWFVGQVAH